MKLTIENTKSINKEKEGALIRIVKTSQTLMQVIDGIERRDITFRNYICGRSGNHVWISRKKDGKRVAIITDKL